MAMSGDCVTSHKYWRMEDSGVCENHGASSVRTLVRSVCLCLGSVALCLLVTLVLYVMALLVRQSEVPYSSNLQTYTHSQIMHPIALKNTREEQEPCSDTPVGSNDRVVSCYYNSPSVNVQHQLLPSSINPHLCTHINVAFASVINKEIFLDDALNKTLLEIIHLKNHNCKLKILLSVGGAGSDNGFSEMVVNHASRKIFIKSIKSVLRYYNLDGIDLDWEFPGVHGYRRRGVGGTRERQHFSQLLHEIRAEYYREKRNYILTIAAAAPETIVNVSYDVDQINMSVDYVNVMTYDFHYYTKYTPFTGFNSPLYPRPIESLYLATLNINYTIHMYLTKGLDRNKIVVGIPTYGHTFTLVNVNNPNVGSPASGVGALGALGFANYPDICVYLREYKNTVEVRYDEAARVPYMHRDKEWVSFEEPRSVIEKAAYIRDWGLRGAMIYSLNADDYTGACQPAGARVDARFPLAHSIRNSLLPAEDQSSPSTV